MVADICKYQQVPAGFPGVSEFSRQVPVTCYLVFRLFAAKLLSSLPRSLPRSLPHRQQYHGPPGLSITIREDAE